MISFFIDRLEPTPGKTALDCSAPIQFVGIATPAAADAGTARLYVAEDLTLRLRTPTDDLPVGSDLGAELDAIAAITGTGGLERTGSGAWSTFALSTFAKTLLDDTTAAAVLQTLGGGTAATGSGAIALAASPTFTGTITAATLAATAITIGGQTAATQSYVAAQLAALVNSAPSTLDTLGEFAAALGSDPNFATTITTTIGTKLAKASNLADLTSASTARANLGLGNVTNDAQTKAAIVPNTLPSTGQLLIGNNTGTGYAPKTLSGHVFIDYTGATLLSNTGVSAGTYANPTLAINPQGRITSATAGSPSPTFWTATATLSRDQSDTLSPATPATLAIDLTGAFFYDGQTISINLSGGISDFEFDTDSNQSTSGTAIDISASSTIEDQIDAIVAAVSASLPGLTPTRDGQTLLLQSTATGSSASITFDGAAGYFGPATGADETGLAAADGTIYATVKAAESGKKHYILSVSATEDSGNAWSGGFAAGYGPDLAGFMDVLTSPTPFSANEFRAPYVTAAAPDNAAAALLGDPPSNTALAIKRGSSSSGAEAADGGQTQTATIRINGFTV